MSAPVSLRRPLGHLVPAKPLYSTSSADLTVPTPAIYGWQDRTFRSYLPVSWPVCVCNASAFVFQTYNLLPVLTALENAEFTLLLQGMPARQRRERVEKLFSEIGLAGLEDRRPAELSGGQQQRVAVARAMVTEPALILADEPTANLDSASAIALLDVMEQLNRTTGTTFLFSTHDPQVMERAHRLIRLRDGQVVSDDTRSRPIAAVA